MNLPRWAVWLMFHGMGGRQAKQIPAAVAAEIERAPRLAFDDQEGRT